MNGSIIQNGSQNGSFYEKKVRKPRFLDVFGLLFFQNPGDLSPNFKLRGISDNEPLAETPDENHQILHFILNIKVFQ